MYRTLAPVLNMGSALSGLVAQAIPQNPSFLAPLACNTFSSTETAMPNSSRSSRGQRSSPQLRRRYRYDADYMESVLDCDAVTAIASAVECAVSLIDDGPNDIEASEERHAAYESQAMR